MKRLWDKGEALNTQIARFTVGRDPELDQHLLRYDALASAAHARMLASINILTRDELNDLLHVLSDIELAARNHTFEIPFSLEDGHTAIENHLTEKLGDAGRRIHTGRSRNDQVIAALRLYGRERLLAIANTTLEIATLLLSLAKTYRATTIAGYTHTRQAMPSTLGFLFAAYAENLLDDFPWMQTAYAHLNRSALGSASGFGVSLPLDREFVANRLGCSSVQRNTLAVQNDRGKTESLVIGAAMTPLLDIARLSNDLIWYSSDELRYVRLHASVTTGSSIMPQKRNPDVLELIRASAARVRSRQQEISAIYSPLSSGYHRDLQLTKEPFIESLETCLQALTAFQPVLQTMTVDESRCRELLQVETRATDEIYRRVAQGTPFRSAYREVAQHLSEIDSDDVSSDWKGRHYLGAPGALTPTYLDTLSDDLKPFRAWIDEQSATVEAVWNRAFDVANTV